MTNIEKYLAFLNGESTEVPQPGPIRKEIYLAAMCGLDVELPAPVTLADAYMYALAMNGVGGGGEDFEITDGSYLFYNGGRNAVYNALVPHFGAFTSMANCFSGSYIGRNALVEFDIHDLDISQCKDFSYAFNYAYLTGEMDWGDVDAGKAENLYMMFKYNPEMTKIVLPNFGSSVNNVTDMFSSCSGLKTIDLNGFDTSNCTTMSGMFSGCSSLEAIDANALNVGNATSLGSLFSDCKKLKSLDVSSWDTSKVQYLSSTFKNCESLKSLDLSGWDTSQVTNLSSMFTGCKALEEIIGFSASKGTGYNIGFPCGTVSSPMALKRLTFRTDLGDGVYSIRSAINIRYCSMDRAGFLEMAESLPDISGLSSLSTSHKTITITGNPCVVDEIVLSQVAIGVTDTTWESFLEAAALRYRGLDYSNAPVYFVETQGTTGVNTTVGELDKETFESGYSYRFLADTITIPDEVKLTDDDKLLVTNKGWILTI